MSFICPVCDYPYLVEPPRKEGCGGSYEICPSCFFEFGVTDDDKGISYEEWREKWIKEGMPWRDVLLPKPDDWIPLINDKIN
jgi:hypothetical protein